MKIESISSVPESMAPLFLLPRINAVAGAFRRERFAVLSAFRVGEPDAAGLARQSELVDRVQAAGLGWFPVFWDWPGRVRRSLFVHTLGREGANRWRSAQSIKADVPAVEPTMAVVLQLRRQVRFDQFICGERGSYLVYGGDPPVPVGAGSKLCLRIDARFIAFRERQGYLVTQRVKRGTRPLKSKSKG